MDKKVNIVIEMLFPMPFQFLGGIFFFSGIVLTLTYPFAGPVLIMAALFIFTSFRGIQFQDNQFRNYNSFFFIKSGNWKDFDSIEKIFINSARVSQKVYTRVTEGTTIRNLEYRAFIKFSDEKKELLCFNNDKEVVIEKITPLAEQEGIEITDNTIDLEK